MFNHRRRREAPRGAARGWGIGVVMTFLCATMAVVAQTPVSVTVNVLPPYSPDLAVWQSNPGRVLVTLTNNDAARSYQVRLAGKGENIDGSVRFTTKENVPVPAITLGPGATRRLNGNDLRLFDAGMIDIVGADRQTIARTGRLPEGTYRLCVRALEHTTLQPLSADDPIGCTQFQIRFIDEPRTLAPACGTTLFGGAPQLVTFQWTTPPGAPAGTRYDLEMVELVPATRSPEEAFRATRSYFFVKKGLNVTTYQYGPTDPKLLAGKHYAWRVRAVDPFRGVVFRNDGVSQACSFTVGLGQVVLLDTTTKQEGVVKKGKLGGGSEPTYLIEPPAEEGECPGGCDAILPSNQSPTATLAVGDTITVGKFKVGLTEVASLGGGQFRGRGKVKIPYLRGLLKVEFNGVTVNTDKQVVSGQVTGMQNTLSPLAPDTATANKVTGVILANLANIVDGVCSRAQQNLVSGLTGLSDFDLPIGLDQTIGGQNYVIGIYGIVLTPQNAKLNALMNFPLPGVVSPQQALSLGATGICFHPDGISGFNGKGIGELKLITDLGYDRPGTFSFLVKGSQQQGQGTAVRFDCFGFKELNLEAEVKFPTSWFHLPNNPAAQAKATMHAKIQDRGNWMGELGGINWEIAALKGFTIAIDKMTYDNSDRENPTGIVFPPDYKGTTDTTWHGFHIGSATITMPEAFKTFQNASPTLAISNLMIDGKGLSTDIAVTNIIQYPTGNLAGWGASLDSIGVRLVSSSFVSGKLAGKINIPISNEQNYLDYTATLSVPDTGSMQYSFAIVPRDTLTADLWLAKLNILPSSHIAITNNNAQKKFVAEAVLNGAFNLPPSVASVTKFALDFQGVAFQNLKVSSDAPYFQAGTWGLASPQKSLGGFPVALKNVHFVTKTVNNKPGIGLQFDITANLFDSLIAGKTTLSILSALGTSASGGAKWEYGGMRVDTIELKTDLGAVAIDGKVAFYYDDDTYGDGFFGKLKASFAKLCEIDATAQFGATKSPGSYRYWYIDGRAAFAAGLPIPGIGAVGFYGFGAAIWHNMASPSVLSQIKAGDAVPGVNTSTLGGGNSGSTFLPDKTKPFGFKGTAVLGTMPKPDAFNADIWLMAELAQSNGSLGIGKIGLGGDGYMMCGVINRPAKPPVKASVAAEYDFIDKVFAGAFDFSFDMAPAVSGHGTLAMRFAGANDWYVHLGTPQSPVSVQTLFLNSSAYMMAGTSLPSARLADVIPTNYRNDFASVFDIYSPFDVPAGVEEPGGGFAFGASTGVSTGGARKILIFYLDLFARAGFDISLRHLPNVQCAGQNGIGMNQWYASGQAYAFLKGDVGIDVDLLVVSGRFSIFNFLGGALIKAQTPNPTWLEGHLAANYNILDGLISGNFSFDFDLGEKCLFISENPLAGLPLITDVKPAPGSTKVPVYVEPQATFAFPLTKTFQLPTYSSSGQSYMRTFRVDLTDVRVVDKNGKPVTNVWRLSNDKLQMGLTPDTILAPNSTYNLKMRVVGFELINGKWDTTRTKAGKAIAHDTVVTFTTGPMPTTLPPSEVLYSYPRYRQRFFLTNQPDARHALAKPWYVRVKQSWAPLFAPKSGDTVTRLFIRYVPIRGEGKDVVTAPYIASGSWILMDRASLAPNTVYLAQVIRSDSTPAPAIDTTRYSYKNVYQKMVAGGMNVARARLTSVGGSISAIAGMNVRERMLYSFHFKTSAYTTLPQKLATIKSNGSRHNVSGDYVAIVPAYETGELFDVYDVASGSYKLSGFDQILEPLVQLDAGSRTAPWYGQFAQPTVYNGLAYLKSQNLMGGQTPLRESRRAVDYFSRPKAILSDYETQRSTGTIPFDDLPQMPVVTGYGSGTTIGSGGWTLGTMTFGNPQFELLYRDGLDTRSDYQLMRNRIAKALSDHQAAVAHNAQVDKLVNAGKVLPQNAKYWTELEPAVVSKLKTMKTKGYQKIGAGTFAVTLTPFKTNSTTTKQFTYTGASSATRSGHWGSINPNSSAQVTFKGYTTP